MTKHCDNSLGEGVFYELDDYAGFGRRLLTIVIDVAVLFFAMIAISTMVLPFAPNAVGTVWLLGLTFAWFYLAVLKPSAWRTVGYRIAGLKIVDLKGQRPSQVRMTFRMLLWLFGPFNLVMDLLWMGADADQQSLRDCYAGTCVVKSNATPIGSGSIHLAYYNAIGFNLMYPRVIRPKLGGDVQPPSSGRING